MDVSVFPISMSKHIGFCVIAVLFFVFQYVRLKYWYELVLAIAVPLSLLVYVSESPVWFYGVGVLELLLLVTAFVLYRKQSKILAAQEAEKAAADAAAKEAAKAAANAASTEPAPAESAPTESAPAESAPMEPASTEPAPTDAAPIEASVPTEGPSAEASAPTADDAPESQA